MLIFGKNNPETWQLSKFIKLLFAFIFVNFCFFQSPLRFFYYLFFCRIVSHIAFFDLHVFHLLSTRYIAFESRGVCSEREFLLDDRAPAERTTSNEKAGKSVNCGYPSTAYRQILVAASVRKILDALVARLPFHRIFARRDSGRPRCSIRCG